jgi:hypothetical protein
MKLSSARRALSAIAVVMLAGACADAPDGTDAAVGTTSQELVTVSLKWSNAGAFTALAPRSDGSALATTKGTALAIGPTGAKTTLYTGSTTPRLQRGSEGFVVPIGKGAVVYDATGVRKGEVTYGANEYAKLVPGSLQTFVPHARSGDPENLDIDQARVFAPDGSLGSTFKTDNLAQSRLTKSHLFWSTRHAIVKSTLAGTTVWTSQVPAHRFEVDDPGRYLIVNQDGDTRVVDIYDGTARLGTSTFDAPVWNIAIAPGGAFSAANSKTVARLFNNGRLAASMQLGEVFPVSLDVSDQGYVLVGTQDRRRKVTVVTLYMATGAVAWNKTLGDDDNAYRPDVHFAPNGRGFFVRDRAGLSFYTMVNP